MTTFLQLGVYDEQFILFDQNSQSEPKHSQDTVITELLFTDNNYR